MKAAFFLFVIVAVFAMAMAGVHHYRVKSSGGHDQPADVSGHHGGSIFDLAANGLNAVKDGIDGIL